MYQDLLTALNDDRMNEEPYVYPYKEHEIEDATKVMNQSKKEKQLLHRLLMIMSKVPING